MYERRANGVKVRADGQGDPWANSHRSLPRHFHMQDIDAIVGVFARNTGNSFFLEYEPDAYKNRGRCLREHRAIALFDRKSSWSLVADGQDNVSLSVYLWMARKLECRFFYVLGTVAPWDIVEIDVYSDEKPTKIGEWQNVDGSNMHDVWELIGLTADRAAASATQRTISAQRPTGTDGAWTPPF